MLLTKASINHCWICGSERNLSHEHKIKASVLRRAFSKSTLWVEDRTSKKGTVVQGIKSNHLKFRHPICEKCNSGSTQRGDRAFDHLLGVGSPNVLLAKKRDTYLDVCRYFGKILGCQIADAGGPIPVMLRHFVQCRSNANRIVFSIDLDESIINAFGQNPNIADSVGHGGLIVTTYSKGQRLLRLGSSLSIGIAKLNFHIDLAFLERLEMKIRFGHFLRSVDIREGELHNNH